jgi:KDO2-lipid IV(A) lauroyltransferase
MRRRRLLRNVRHAIEAGAVLALYGIFRLLPFDWASGIGGFLGRAFGPRLGISRRGRRNIRLVMPELGEAQVERIVVEMWDNLGRMAAEVPHINRLDPADGTGRLEILGTEHLPRIKSRGAVLFSGHLANWEVMGIAAARAGVDLAIVYRAANNPWIERLIQNLRPIEMLPKGARGARAAVAALKSGRVIGLVVDQKMNDGIEVPFFGRPAMTAPAAVDLARKFDVPVHPIRIERLNGARFRVSVLPALDLPVTSDRHADLEQGMTRVNAVLEQWIRERPGQWLWLHRRWPES